MREILFKAKRKDNGEWVFGSLVKTKHDGVYICNPNFIPAKTVPNSWFIEVDPETLCQYTGLEDVDGNKIFEGDILTSYFHQQEIVVKCLEDAFYWHFLSTDKGFRPSIYAKKKCKVTGKNIHD